MRGSKSEITELATVKTISVKEQRVDGSCFGLHLLLCFPTANWLGLTQP